MCADGRFKVTRVQPAEGKKIEAGEWANSAKLAVGAGSTKRAARQARTTPAGTRSDASRRTVT